MNPFTALVARAAEAAPGTTDVPALPTAAWDIVSFLTNSMSYIKIAGGGLLMLMGVVSLIWGGVILLIKLFGSGQGATGQTSWMKIIMMIVIGGAIAVGGFSLVFTIGSGGKKTIEDLGGASIFFDSLPVFGSLFGLG